MVIDQIAATTQQQRQQPGDRATPGECTRTLAARQRTTPDLARATAPPPAAGSDDVGAHTDAPLRRIRTISSGAPRNAVTTPTGSSLGTSTRPRMSAARNIAGA